MLQGSSRNSRSQFVCVCVERRREEKKRGVQSCKQEGLVAMFKQYFNLFISCWQYYPQSHVDNFISSQLLKFQYF